MKKSLLITNIILSILILIGDILYMTIGGLLIKSLTSAGFVVLGVINLIYVLRANTYDRKFAIIMTIGLFFAMLGDIILEINFIFGAVLFAIGHIFFFVSFCTLKSFHPKDLIVGSFIFLGALLLILLLPAFDFGSTALKLVCILYALIISVMVSKAIMNLIREKNGLNVLIAIGSILFVISDLMLLFNVFADISSIFGFLCLATYYPAEILFAISIANARFDTKNKLSTR